MVFCLGLSRTGTRSVHRALQRLGLRSVHYPLDFLHDTHEGSWRLNWARLADIDAVSDIVLLPFLDAVLERFPEAKLVWTSRDVEKWITACSAHVPIWERGIATERTKAVWLRERVYGSPVPSKAELRRAYARWNDRVSEAARTHPLLRFPVTDGAGWVPLCDFLGKDVPREAFPHESDAL